MSYVKIHVTLLFTVSSYYITDELYIILLFAECFFTAMYICKACDYASSDIDSLMSFMRIHTEEKPSKCSQCDMTF